MGLNFMTFLQGVSLFTGWLTRAAADGKIDGREWAELGLGIASILGISTDLVLPEVPTPEDMESETTIVADAGAEAGAEDRPPPYPPGKGETPV